VSAGRWSVGPRPGPSCTSVVWGTLLSNSRRSVDVRAAASGPGSARPGAPRELRGHALGPEVERAIDLGPGLGCRDLAPPAVDAFRQQHVGLRVADLSLDRRGFEEATRLQIQCAAAGAMRPTGATRGREHVQYRVRGMRVGDPEADPHHAGSGLVDEAEVLLQVRAHRALEVGDEPQEVLLRHRLERSASAPPERHGLEHHGVVRVPVRLRVAVDQMELVRAPFAQERVVVEEAGRVRRRDGSPTRAGDGRQQKEQQHPSGACRGHSARHWLSMVTVASFLLDCALPMGRPARVATLAAVALLAFAGRALATEYPAWGDTGWIYASKAACCNEAIGIASRYSEEEGANTGGMPSRSAAGAGQRGTR